MVVQHNMQAANANRMLGITVGNISKSTEKLSSGYRINRAADDAAGLSISEKMRKQIRGLSQASTNAQDGISAVQTTEGALTEVHSMLQRMNELAVQSANGTNSQIDRDAIQAEIDQLGKEIDRVSETTKFNETYLLKGDVNGKTAIKFKYNETSDTVTLKEGAELFTRNSDGSFAAVSENAILDSDDTYYVKKDAASISQAGTAIAASDSNTYLETSSTESVFNSNVSSLSLYVQNSDGTYEAVEEGDIYTGQQSDYYTMSSTTNGIEYKAATATAISSSNYDEAYKLKSQVYDKDGNVVEAGKTITVTELSNCYSTVGDKDVYETIAWSAASASYGDNTAIKFLDADENEIPANGLYRYFDDDGNYSGKGLYYKDKAGNLQQLENTEDDIKLIKANIDTSKSEKTGSLKLSLHVGADATDNNKISIEISSMSAETLGVKDLKVDSEENATKAIDTISAALQKVSEQRSALGAVQNRLEHTISNLDNVVENTTSAESRIRDVDMAEEMVTYSKNSILQQAGQSMLAQANQANQGVLSLLG